MTQPRTLMWRECNEHGLAIGPREESRPRDQAIVVHRVMTAMPDDVPAHVVYYEVIVDFNEPYKIKPVPE